MIELLTVVLQLQIVAFVLEAFFSEMEISASAKESEGDGSSSDSDNEVSILLTPIMTRQNFGED